MSKYVTIQHWKIWERDSYSKKKGNKNMGNIFDILGPVMVGPSSPPHSGSSQDRVWLQDSCSAVSRRGQKPYLHGSLLQQERGIGTDRGADRRIIGDDAGRYADTGQLRSCKRHGDGFCNEE